MKGIITAVMLFAIAGLLYYNKNAAVANQNAAVEAQSHKLFVPTASNRMRPRPIPIVSPESPADFSSVAAPSRAATFSCDGRQHCSQMRSCEEAEYFIRHCPNTKMDGDNDGVPCENQFC